MSGPADCGIAIMAKASAPGRTKTRLVPPLTFDQSAALNTAFLQDIAGNLMVAGRHASIAGYAAFAPAGTESFFQNHPAAHNRADRGLSADFRRMPVAYNRANPGTRAPLGGGAQFRLADAADGAFDRNRRRAGATRRARRARAGDRRRLLSAGIEDRAPPAVRRYRLEYRARVRTDT